jgi:anti-sigma B factor antagonist
MNLTADPSGDLLIVRVMEDRIDAASAITFKERMRELIQTPLPRVLLDMSGVNFLDSSGLGAIVSVMKLMGEGRKLELASLTPTVDKVFRLTRMNAFLTIHDAVPQPGTPGMLNAG